MPQLQEKTMTAFYQRTIFFFLYTLIKTHTHRLTHRDIYTIPQQSKRQPTKILKPTNESDKNPQLLPQNNQEKKKIKPTTPIPQNLNITVRFKFICISMTVHIDMVFLVFNLLVLHRSVYKIFGYPQCPF